MIYNDEYNVMSISEYSVMDAINDDTAEFGVCDECLMAQGLAPGAVPGAPVAGQPTNQRKGLSTLDKILLYGTPTALALTGAALGYNRFFGKNKANPAPAATPAS